MNSPGVSRLNRQMLPLIPAAALLGVCGVLLMHRVPESVGTPVLSLPPKEKAPPVSSDPPSPSSLPGVFSLPPATLAGIGPVAPSASHRPPPDSRERFSLADLKAQMPQREDGTFVIEVPTLHFSASDPAARQVMDGQPVETLAQIATSNGSVVDLSLSRLLTHCCSADARPFYIGTSFSGPAPALGNASWVKVRGRIAYQRRSGGFRTVLNVESVTQAPAPLHPVLQ